MDTPHDMDHVKNANDLTRELTITEHWPTGVYGDTIGGKSFSDEQSEILLRTEKKFRPILACGWREVWSNLTVWTVIDTSPETADEIAMLHEIEESERVS